MSRLYRRGGAWYVDYIDERGNRVRQGLPGVTSKREAQQYLAELVAQVRRRKLGLEPTAVRGKLTVWALVDWWLTSRCPPASAKLERQRLEKHVKGTELGLMPVEHVSATHFSAHFANLQRPNSQNNKFVMTPLSPASVNHVRAKLRTAFERARREGVFTGINPLLDTQKLKSRKREHETLSLEEVPRALAMVAPQWRGFVATAVFLALRKGEIGGLYKRDVDLANGIVRVRRSWERDTTKGGEGAELPIPAPLVPYLEAAMESPGPFMFPDAKGGMLPRESDPHLRLKTALKRAGIVDGYRLTCRTCKREGLPTGELVAKLAAPSAKCARHGKTLWITPIARAVRLHDMRHSTATILLRAGVPLHHVQRILRHASSDTTTSTYAHLVTPDLRKAMQSLEVGTKQAQPIPTPPHPTKETTMTTERSRRDSNARPLASEAEGRRFSVRSPLNALAANGPAASHLREVESGTSSVPFAPAPTNLAQRRHKRLAAAADQEPDPRAFRGGMTIAEEG